FEAAAASAPDAMTGMEASLRFAGPETMETKIFGRLSAWQNWIFQRPNAVGERGAPTLSRHAERRGRARRAHALRQARAPRVQLATNVISIRRVHRFCTTNVISIRRVPPT